VLFGFNSGAALVTVVGVLVEVPVMLSVVRITTAIRAWYERQPTSRSLGQTRRAGPIPPL
jgi:ACR3 family arsenite transporter